MFVSVKNSEDLIGWSRRGMWFSLMCFLFAAIAGASIAIGAGAAQVGETMLRIFPVFAILGVFHVGRTGARVSKRELHALESDELRQHATAKSFKYAFGSMLAVQPALALLPVFLVVEYPAVLMAIATIGVGLAVNLGTVLWLDR